MSGNPSSLGAGLGGEGGLFGIASGRDGGVVPDFFEVVAGAGESLEDGGAILDEIMLAEWGGGKISKLREGEFGLPVREGLVGIEHSVGGASQPVEAMESAEEEAAEAEVIEAAS